MVGPLVECSYVAEQGPHPWATFGMALGLAIVWPLAQPLVGSGLAFGLALRLALGWLWPGPWLTFGLTLGLAPVLALGWLFAWAMAGTWGRIRNQRIYPAEYVWLDTFNQILVRFSFEK